MYMNISFHLATFRLRFLLTWNFYGVFESLRYEEMKLWLCCIESFPHILPLKRPATHPQKKGHSNPPVKSQHQIASERRYHPYNVIPLPSTLATTPENRVNGRDLFRAFQRDGYGWFFFLSLLLACWSPDFVVIFYPFLFQWRNVHCKKIACIQHLAKCRVFFCPIHWATKTHQTNFTTSILCNHKQNLEHIQNTRPLCCCSSSSSGWCCCCCCCCCCCFRCCPRCCFLLVLARSPLLRPWGTPTLHGRCCWNSYRPSSHLAEAEGADAQPVVDSLIRSKGYWRLVMRIFFRSSKLGKKYPKKQQNEIVWSNFFGKEKSIKNHLW